MVDSSIQRRDPRIDFFRGIALVFLLWDHVTGSVFGHLTLRNFGFSDAAELFVFLAGSGAMLAYGKVYLRDGYYPMTLRVLRRTWVLYVAHVFILAQLMGVVFVANAQVETRDFIAETGLTYFIEQPQRALVSGLLLGFKPMLMDPLPLYMLLLVLGAIAIPHLLRHPLRVLVPSFAVYVFAQRFGVNLPARPDGVWFFNPLTWQFLFVLGASFAAPSVGQGGLVLPERARRAMLPAAVVFLACAGVLALSWRVPQWHDAWMPRRIATWLYPISKTDLDPLRLLHFLALALCVSQWVRPGAWLQRSLPVALRLMGRHSLEVFCFGVLLAPLLDALNALADERFVVQVLTGFGGAGLLWGLAWLIEEYASVTKRGARRPDTAEEIALQRSRSSSRAQL